MDVINARSTIAYLDGRLSVRWSRSQTCR